MGNVPNANRNPWPMDVGFLESVEGEEGCFQGIERVSLKIFFQNTGGARKISGQFRNEGQQRQRRRSGIAMKKRLRNTLLIMGFAFLFWGCPSDSRRAEREASSARPEITLNVATLNLAEFPKRIERSHISSLGKSMKNETVDVFTVQGHYTVSGRIDESGLCR